MPLLTECPGLSEAPEMCVQLAWCRYELCVPCALAALLPDFKSPHHTPRSLVLPIITQAFQVSVVCRDYVSFLGGRPGPTRSPLALPLAPHLSFAKLFFHTIGDSLFLSLRRTHHYISPQHVGNRLVLRAKTCLLVCLHVRCGFFLD